MTAVTVKVAARGLERPRGGGASGRAGRGRALLPSPGLLAGGGLNLKPILRPTAAAASSKKDDPSLDQQQAEAFVPEELRFPDQQSTQRRVSEAPPSLLGQILQPGDELQGGKYVIQQVLGSGSNAVTYQAVSRDGTEVAVKTLSLRGLQGWKQLELFEREASTLRGLNHPGIPKYLEYFEDDSESDRRFYLVQELAEGKSLAAIMKDGTFLSEDQVKNIAKQLLVILSYLANLRPAVVHRDVKPENVVLDGDVVRLVDFGGVQEASVWGEGMQLGSTIVGTYGYMAPEQFRGAAGPSSDLYALGGTLLYLLSGQAPSSFPQSRLRIDFQKRVGMSPMLEELLTGLLEPLPEDRISVKEALAILDGKSRKKASGSSGQASGRMQMNSGFGRRTAGGVTRIRKPAGTRVEVRPEGRATVIDIPPAQLGLNTIGDSAFAVMWNVFVGYWTIGALAGGGLLFAAFSVPFWFAGANLLKSSFGGYLTRSTLEIGPTSWRLVKQLAVLNNGAPSWGEGGSNEVIGNTADLQRTKVTVSSYINGEPQPELVLQEGVKRHDFAEGLTLQEKEWLASVINEAIQKGQADMDSSDDPDDYGYIN